MRILILPIALVLVVLLGLGSASCAHTMPTPKKAVSIPINAENANNIGSLHLELVYDPVVLEPIEVEKGMLS